MSARMDRKRDVRGWLSRIGWLIAIWGISVAALGIAASLMKLLMRAAGLTP